MSENYALINGKRIELTDEQVKALGVETRKNPFERVATGDEYYTITGYDNTVEFTEDGNAADQNLYDAGNYFNDEDFAKQVALHQLLYRKLLKFAYDNRFEDTGEWNGVNQHWHIIYNALNDDFTSMIKLASKELTAYFSTEECASRAITEVIRPFMKEHPEFVW